MMMIHSVFEFDPVVTGTRRISVIREQEEEEEIQIQNSLVFLGNFRKKLAD